MTCSTLGLGEDGKTSSPEYWATILWLDDHTGCRKRNRNIRFSRSAFSERYAKTCAYQNISPAYKIHYTENRGNKNLRTSVAWTKPVQIPKKEPMSLRKSVENPGWRDFKPSCQSGSQPPAQIDPGPIRRQQGGQQVVFAYPLRTGRRCDEILQGCHFPLGLPRCHAQPEYFSFQGQEGHFRLEKTTGDLQGAELTVFHCESCTDFLGFCGMDDEGYFDTLVGMIAQAQLKTVEQDGPDSRCLSRSGSISCDEKGTTMAIVSGRTWTT